MTKTARVPYIVFFFFLLHNSASIVDKHKKGPNYKESSGSAAGADTPSAEQASWEDDNSSICVTQQAQSKKD